MVEYFKVFFKVVMSCSIGILAIAWWLDYHYDLGVCRLCYYQRYAYMLIIVAALIGIFLPFLHKFLGVLIVLLYLANVSTALTQVLMEEGFISAPSACSGVAPTQTLSLEEYKQHIIDNEFVPCDIPSLQFLRISIAGYNLVASAAMLLFSTIFVGVFIFFRYGDAEAARKVK